MFHPRRDLAVVEFFHHIPSNVWQKAKALEDTLDVDVFDPPPQDWRDGTDSCFHKQ